MIILGESIVPSFAHRKRAGSVKIAPAATDSPAEPIVWTRLFSRMESLRRMTRMIPMEITAAGIEAEIVIPTRRPRYAFAAPKTMASRIPIRREVTVNSGTTRSAGIYGLKLFLLSDMYKFFLSFLKISFPIHLKLQQNLLYQSIPAFPRERGDVIISKIRICYWLQ